MSKIGRKPILIPPGVTVALEGSRATIRGPKGELSFQFSEQMSILQEENSVVVRRPTDERRHRALHGTTRSLVANMVQGVSQGFEKALDIVGVGYRAQKAGEKLVFQLGFSHPVEVSPPPGISFALDSPTRLRVLGTDKALVGQVAAQIRAIRPPDSYKGKGVKYAAEVLHLKPGKAGKGVKK